MVSYFHRTLCTHSYPFIVKAHLTLVRRRLGSMMIFYISVDLPHTPLFLVTCLQGDSLVLSLIDADVHVPMCVVFLVCLCRSILSCVACTAVL